MVKVSKFGRSIEIDDDTASVGWWQQHFETWEDDTFRTFDRVLNPQQCFVDLGGWIGTTCLYAAKRSKNVVVVEPDPLALADLRRNIRKNEFTNIVVCSAPVCDGRRDVVFGPRDADGEWNLSTSTIKGSKTSPLDVSVQSITVADLFSRHDIDDVSLIKVDIEGGEEDILCDLFHEAVRQQNRGGANAVKPAIYLSFHYTWWKERNIDDYAHLWSRYTHVYLDLKPLAHKDVGSTVRSQPFCSLLFSDADMVMRNVPAYIVAYNNPTHVKNTVRQLQRYASNITVLDNASTNRELLEYYDRADGAFKIECAHRNEGVDPLYYLLLDRHRDSVFLLTDPDLQLNGNTPARWIETLFSVMARFDSFKVGLALDITEPRQYRAYEMEGKPMYVYERQFWLKRVRDTELELYDALIDTTMTLVRPANERHHTRQYECIRVAGDYCCQHIPWYKCHEHEMKADEAIEYMRNNVGSHYNTLTELGRVVGDDD